MNAGALPWQVESFSQGSLEGRAHPDAPALLRRVADGLEQLGDGEGTEASSRTGSAGLGRAERR
ncbi:MAG: hypothetical protein HGA44_07760 [Cellulomonadaceae bacterium]|nr:hypothetical protein [Cellulomonadaceae bacterium]